MSKGRTSKFTQALADKICERLAAGETLRAICEDENMPDERTVRRWAIDVDHPFSPQYARAREVGFEKMADDLIDIADGKAVALTDQDADVLADVVNPNIVQRDRLRVETRKWLLSKALPKVYGEKTTVDMNVANKDIASLTDAELERIITANGGAGTASKANGKAKPN